MDRGSSSFSKRLRALTSRPDGAPGEEAPGEQPGGAPQDAIDEQPTGEFAPVSPGPVVPPPRYDAGDTELPAATEPPAAEDAPPGDDQDTIEWRAIRLPDDSPTLEPPKLQKPSKTPRPVAPAPAEESFAKPEAVRDPAPQQPTPAPGTVPAPAPEFATDSPPAQAAADVTPPQGTASRAAAPVAAPIPPDEGDAPGGLRSLWQKRARPSRDPDIVSFDSGQPTPEPPATEPQPPAPAAPEAPAASDAETRNLTAALRRFKPAKQRQADEPAADEPRTPTPANATPSAELAQPAAAPSAPAPPPAPIPEKPSFAERATLRRRAKSLRARRDAGLLELGAIVLDQRRFGDASGGVLTRKRTDELTDLDNELAEIEIALGEDRPLTAVDGVGVERCHSCSALLGPRDRFCAQCGAARSDAGSSTSPES